MAKKNVLLKGIAVLALMICALICVSCAAKCKVDFIVDGESFTSVMVESGKTVDCPLENPEKEGYVFKCWCYDEECLNEYDFSTTITKATTLYARFAELFTVSFVYGEETLLSEEVECDTLCEMPENPQVEGFIFKGWYLDDDFTVEFDFSSPITEDLTVYARFEVLHMVTFVIDGEEYACQEVEDGEVATEPEKPIIDGYVLKKWCQDEAMEFGFDFETPIFEDTTIYGLLAEAYKVNYADEGGNITFSENVEKGVAPQRPSDPEKEDYKLSGWYLDAELTNRFNFDYEIEDGTILYPKYEKIIVIYTADSLKEIANKPNGYFRLGCDINLMGEAWTPIVEFSGELDGNGYKIEYFTITTDAGISGFIATNNGIIKNIVFEDIVLNETYGGHTLWSGTIVGLNNGVVENCTLENYVASYKASRASAGGSAAYVIGGFVGLNYGTVKDCSISGELHVNHIGHGYHASAWHYYYSSRSSVGGMLGVNEGGSVIGCYANVKIETYSKFTGENYSSLIGHSNGYTDIGGFVAHNTGLIDECGVDYSIATTGTMDGYSTFTLCIGGFIRINSEGGQIAKSFSRGTITENCTSATEKHIGGFVQNNQEMIKDCYSQAEITTCKTAACIGGFVGNSCKTITSCYSVAKINVATVNNIGGFLGYAATNSTINACVSSAEIYYASASCINVFAGKTESGGWYEKSLYDLASVIMQGEIAIEYAESSSGILGKETNELFSEETLFDELFWNVKIWNLDGENAPTLKWEE